MSNNINIKSPWKRNYEQSKAQERMDKERITYDKKQAQKELEHLLGNITVTDDGYDDEVWLGQ